MASLTSLPPELLRDAIEATVPHTYHSETYKERQSTLCSLSLVSRQFRAIAQPLLFEIVSIGTDDQLRSFLEGQSGTFEPKELVVGRFVNSERTWGLLSRSKGLQSLMISRWREDPFDLEVLVQHSKLDNLQLFGDGFDFNIRSPFTSLRSFTLGYQALDSAALLLLDPEILPSLQALGLSGVTTASELRRLGETNLSRLLPQLDAIVIHPNLHRLGINGLFSGYSSRILIDVGHETLHSPRLIQTLTSVQHVRIQRYTTFTSYTSARILNLLAASRESKNSSLKSIYLPLEWRLSSLKLPGIITEMKQIMEDYEKGGIELVLESQPESSLDHYISREFWARQRRRRKEE